MAASQITNNPPFQGAEIEAAYKAIYGGLPTGMMDRKGNLDPNIDVIYPGSVLQTPTGENINASQLMYMYRQSPAGQKAAQAGSGQTGQTPSLEQLMKMAPPPSGGGTPPTSYLTGQAGTGSSNMTTWNDLAQQYGISQQDINAFTQRGWSPAQVASSYQKGYAKSSPQAASTTPQQNAFGITSKDSGKGYTTLTTNKGQTVNVDNAGNYFTTDAQGNNTPVSDVDAQKMGFQSVNPEARALKQMGQIDPGTEALRSQLSGSYLDPNKRATAADYQSYLDTFKAVDPEEYAQRKGLATSMDSYLKSVQGQYALGSQLDPVTARQVEQQARASQAARGNVYGTPQMVSEAMATGQAGEQRLQQRQAALGQALQGQQSYLGAGLGMGDTAMQLYQQGLQNRANAQQSALGYLGSGSTPYQAGASYLDRANAAAAGAAQGGPVYNPTSLGQGNLGTAQQAPQYGLDVGAQSQNYFNSLNNAYGGGGGATKNRQGAAMAGAASGALSGAATGAAVSGPYAPVGAVVGGLAGGAMGYAGGYYS